MMSVLKGYKRKNAQEGGASRPGFQSDKVLGF